MKRPAALSLLLVGLVLTACSGTAASPAPTVTVTAVAEPKEASAPPTGDEWQRFRDDPKEAFVFASEYQIIMGAPIGNGEGADAVVELSWTLCSTVETGGSTWDEVTAQITRGDVNADAAARYVLLAGTYCPEVEG